jgi:hypothetical protein
MWYTGINISKGNCCHVEHRYPEDGGRRFFQHICTYLSKDKVSLPKNYGLNITLTTNDLYE